MDEVALDELLLATRRLTQSEGGETVQSRVLAARFARYADKEQVPRGKKRSVTLV